MRYLPLNDQKFEKFQVSSGFQSHRCFPIIQRIFNYKLDRGHFSNLDIKQHKLSRRFQAAGSLKKSSIHPLNSISRESPPILTIYRRASIKAYSECARLILNRTSTSNQVARPTISYQLLCPRCRQLRARITFEETVRRMRGRIEIVSFETIKKKVAKILY